MQRHRLLLRATTPRAPGSGGAVRGSETSATNSGSSSGSQLQAAFQRVFPIVAHHVSAAADDGAAERRARVVRDAVAHLVNAQRWGLAAEAEQFVRAMWVRSEVAAAERELAASRARVLAAHLALAFYTRACDSPTGVGGNVASVDGFNRSHPRSTGHPTSLWQRSLAAHMADVTARATSGDSDDADVQRQVADTVEKSLSSAGLGGGGSDLSSFAVADGLNPAADLTAKAVAICTVPALRSVVHGAGFRVAVPGCTLEHALHVTACALLLTVLPERLLVAPSQPARDAIARARDASALLRDRLAARASLMPREQHGNGRGGFVAAYDLEDVLLVAPQAQPHGTVGSSVDVDARHTRRYVPGVGGALKEVRDRHGTERFLAGTQLWLRRSVVPSTIAVRAFSDNVEARTLTVRGVGMNATDAERESPNKFVLPAGASPDTVVAPGDHALATFLRAAVLAARRFRHRSESDDVLPEARAAVVQELTTLVTLAAALVQQSLLPRIHLVPFVHLVAAVAAVHPAGDGGRLWGTAAVVVALVRLVADIDPADHALMREASASLESLEARTALESSGGDGDACAVRVLNALRAAVRTPAPRTRWEPALRLMAVGGDPADGDGAEAVRRAVLALARSRHSIQTSAPGQWELTMRLFGALRGNAAALRAVAASDDVLASTIGCIATDKRATWSMAAGAVAMAVEAVRATSTTAVDELDADDDGDDLSAPAAASRPFSLPLLRAIGEALPKAVPAAELVSAMTRIERVGGFRLADVAIAPALMQLADAGRTDDVVALLAHAYRPPRPFSRNVVAPVFAALQHAGQWPESTAALGRLKRDGIVDAADFNDVIVLTSTLELRPPMLAARVVDVFVRRGAEAVYEWFFGWLRLCPEVRRSVLLYGILRAIPYIGPFEQAARKNFAEKLGADPATAKPIVVDLLRLHQRGDMPTIEVPSDTSLVALATRLPLDLESVFTRLSEACQADAWPRSALQKFEEALLGTASAVDVLRRSRGGNIVSQHRAAERSRLQPRIVMGAERWRRAAESHTDDDAR